MFARINLKKLAQITAPDRAFLSIYLKSPASLKLIKKRLKHIKTILKDNKDETLHLQENIHSIENYFKENPYKSGSLCIFSCWMLSYLEAYPLNVDIPDLVRVNSSPYIRPIAELQDEYENFVVLVADNNMAKIFLITSAKIDSEEHIEGNIKNHVKKGGWSQQRYERRRDKQLLHYSKEIIEKLLEIDGKEDFRRILLVGAKEIILEVKKKLPGKLMKKLVGEKNISLAKDDKLINEEIFKLFFIEERLSEKNLWERIKREYLSNGLAALGVRWVFEEAKSGNIEKLIVNHNTKITGLRCRDCEYLSDNVYDYCPHCSSQSIFKVDFVNEIVELCALTGGEVDFVSPIPALAKIGDMAALLRYKS